MTDYFHLILIVFQGIEGHMFNSKEMQGNHVVNVFKNKV